MPEEFACPVCGYPALSEPPWDEGIASDEICPRCKIQFGYDDAAGGDSAGREQIYAEWRANFVKPS